MIKYTVIFLLIVHVLCDFYCQTELMAKKKQKQFRWVAVHSFVYGIISGALLILFMPGLPPYFLLLFVFSHAIIDIAKYCGCNCKYKNFRKLFMNKRKVFLADQFAHVSVIILIAYSIRNSQVNTLYNTHIMRVFEELAVSEVALLSWIIKILLIHKPANLFISDTLYKFRPINKSNEDFSLNEKNVGRMIGTLERIIMTIFLSIQQYSAVGLVLTAKSIARYDKISRDQQFSEYYLLGTLLSAICAIGVSILF